MSLQNLYKSFKVNQNLNKRNMSLRSNIRSIKQPQPPQLPPTPPPPPPSLPQQAFSQAFAGTANLAKLLPSGTLLAFQLLAPIFTNNGSCDSVTRTMTSGLLLLLAAFCFIACFTDSFRSPDGKLHYGLATLHGIWLFDYYDPAGDSCPPDLTKYRLRIIDCVHGVLSLLVFASLALRDKNVVNCFYPRPEKEAQEVLNILPLGVGVACSLLFVVFPTRRHGIGYPANGSNIH